VTINASAVAEKRRFDILEGMRARVMSLMPRQRPWNVCSAGARILQPKYPDITVSVFQQRALEVALGAWPPSCVTRNAICSSSLRAAAEARAQANPSPSWSVCCIPATSVRIRCCNCVKLASLDLSGRGLPDQLVLAPAALATRRARCQRAGAAGGALAACIPGDEACSGCTCRNTDSFPAIMLT
jgi:hypothetical protein